MIWLWCYIFKIPEINTEGLEKSYFGIGSPLLDVTEASLFYLLASIGLIPEPFVCMHHYLNKIYSGSLSIEYYSYWVHIEKDRLD